MSGEPVGRFLTGVRVLDLSTGIGGGYCAKLLADGGAEVLKLEPAGGDPLRGGAPGEPAAPDTAAAPAALFTFLHAGHRCASGDLAVAERAGLVDQADLVIESGQLTDTQCARLRAEHPDLVVVSLSPFGRSGPWRDMPATEFTLQAWCGSLAFRGTEATGPLQVGGHLGEWTGGLYGAAMGVMAALGARRGCGGDHLDVSELESMAIMLGGYYRTLYADMGGKRPTALARSIEVPSVVPAADGFVGFCTNTAPQFAAFLELIERPDLKEDPELRTSVGRQRQRDSFSKVIAEWTRRHRVEEIIEAAVERRIPVAPIGQPETLFGCDHLVARHVFVDGPNGAFRQPRPPYLVDGRPVAPGTRMPVLEDAGALHWLTAEPPEPAPAEQPPAPDPGSTGAPGPAPASQPTRAPGQWLAGVRVIDLTTFWAGPAATQLFACAGADVVKVESVQRPDGIRFSSTQPHTTEKWWEWSPLFQTVNVNKQSVTLNLSAPEGREVLGRLIAGADVVVENYSPRVLDNFGITWDWVRARNPRAIVVRMPAFGLDGPWRDRTGFAQTMEQASGMAWMTGLPDGPPVVPRGPCDPIAGIHAAFVAAAALWRRQRTGTGCLLEVPMIEAALNVAAELTIAYDAYRIVLGRDGNRDPAAAPQGIYPCRGEEQWLAVSVATDDQWSALRSVLGDPGWAATPNLDRAAGRRAEHAMIDEHVVAWARGRDLHQAVAELLAAGVPAAPVVDPIEVVDHPQLRARHFVEPVEHPVLGRREVVGLPVRAASRPAGWVTRPAPCLGQHNQVVLGPLVGPEGMEMLAAHQVVGERPTQ